MTVQPSDFWSGYIQSQGVIHEVPIKDCFADKYNDNLREWRVQQLVTSWDWRLFEPPTLSRRKNGKYAIIEGRHRLEAAKRVTSADFRVPARILGDLSYEDEAFLAHELNRLRRRWSARERFKALVESKNSDATALVAACARAGFKVRGIDDGGRAFDAIDSVDTLRAIQRRMGLPVLTKTLQVLRDAWEGKESGSPVLFGVAAVLYTYPFIDLPRLTLVLKRQSSIKVIAEIKGRQSVLKGSPESVAAYYLIDLYNQRLTKGRIDPAVLRDQFNLKAHARSREAVYAPTPGPKPTRTT